MRALGVVCDEVGIEVDLHLLDGLEPLLAGHDSEVIVEQGTVHTLVKPVALRELIHVVTWERGHRQVESRRLSCWAFRFPRNWCPAGLLALAPAERSPAACGAALP